MDPILTKARPMEATEKQGSSTMRKVAIALLAGLAVLVLLFYWGGGQPSDPPTCFGMFGWWTVPCEGWVAPAAGAASAAVVGLALWLNDRRR